MFPRESLAPWSTDSRATITSFLSALGVFFELKSQSKQALLQVESCFAALAHPGCSKNWFLRPSTGHPIRDCVILQIFCMDPAPSKGSASNANLLIFNTFLHHKSNNLKMCFSFIHKVTARLHKEENNHCEVWWHPGLIRVYIWGGQTGVTGEKKLQCYSPAEPRLTPWI